MHSVHSFSLTGVCAARVLQVERAKEYTNKVKHETRREVRDEGKSMFQAQRDAVAASEKEKQKSDAIVIEETRAKYKQRQAALKNEVVRFHEVARQAREKIVEDRKQVSARSAQHLLRLFMPVLSYL